MISLFKRWFALLVLWTLAAANGADPVSEEEVKAAYIYNFSQFTLWPATSFPGPVAPIIIWTIGDTAVTDALMSTVRNKTVEGRPFEVKNFPRLPAVIQCHILFVADSERRRLPQIMAATRGLPTLTVGETAGFARAGGMINFFPDGARIRFEINTGAVDRGQIKISSRLLKLARIVADEPP